MWAPIGNMFNVNDPINDPPILGPVNGWEVGAGAAPGTLQDLDGDGDKDIGATDARFAISLEGNANGFGGAPAYTGTGPAAEFHVYSFEMPITQLRLGNVTVQLERSPIPTAFEWREDVPTGYNKNGLNGTVGVTNGVAINVIPEPRTIALAVLALAGVALAIRRRT